MQGNARTQFEQIVPKNVSPRILKWIAVAIAALILLVSAFFTIEPEEVGVVLRFGKYVRTVNPGLNLKIPLGIEKVYKVPVERQLKLEFGFRTEKGDVRSEYSSTNFLEESLMLTGDLNAADVEWIVQYRISDPFKFLFRVRNTVQTFRDINEAIMREIVGDRTVNEVLTVGRQEVAATASSMLQSLADQYEMGVKVEQVVLQDVNPPEQVKPAFNEVNEAQQEREKLINQARSEYNKIIPKARGDAQRTIEEANGYALQRVNNAKGEAAKFNAIYGEYSKAKEVTRQRIYLETMNDVLQKVGKKLITDEKASGILPLFNLSKEGIKNE
ncbi:MAG: FtsH protease activity modulator HflK [Chitinispirillaceae bacterium]|nr:FtsH protease activity modulator HflK [Chitinispirillaceae bacterium]